MACFLANNAMKIIWDPQAEIRCFFSLENGTATVVTSHRTDKAIGRHYSDCLLIATDRSGLFVSVREWAYS